MIRLAMKRLTTGISILLLSGGLVAVAQPTGNKDKPATGKERPAAGARVQLLPGAWVDWEHGTVEASGSSAADLFAPSADVARIKAERLARLRAAEKLRKALALLTGDEKQRPRLAAYGGAEQVSRLDVERARVLSVDHAASGSVSLRLALPLTAPPPAEPSSAPADGGADSTSGAGGGAGRGSGE
jgi:hypothetical protein